MYVIDPTNPSSTLDDRVKHRLYVRRRAADNAKHLGGRRLMFQSFPQFCIALLDLLEQWTFSMAMTAWSAKVFRSAICFSVNGRTSVRRIWIAPIGIPSRKSGVAKAVRMPLDGAAESGNSVSAATAISWI